MSIYKYENAIIEKLREILGDDKIFITPSDNVINVVARISQDKIQLPLLQISRESWNVMTKHHGKKMNGHINDQFPLFKYCDYTCECDGKIHRLHLLPMNFTHKISVWTNNREENDELVRELLWFFATMGRLYVDIPYGVNLTHEFTLEVDSGINDESDISGHVEKGQLFVQSFIIKCEDAALWKSSEHNPTCIHITPEVKELNHHRISSPNYNRLRDEE